MNPTRKKTRIITRSRYSARIYRGKENAVKQGLRCSCFAARLGHLSFRKGEGEGEGLIYDNCPERVRELAGAVPKPLTLVLSPCSKGRGEKSTMRNAEMFARVSDMKQCSRKENSAERLAKPG
jgi:hypothetical protein